jgi:hypothetical protein
LQDGVSYNPFDWKVYVDGVVNDDHESLLSGPEPAFHSGDLKKGRKVKGYIVFQVPATGEVRLAFEDDVFEVIIREK